MENRYTVNISAYIYANSNEEAITKSKELSELLNLHALEDPQAITTKLTKTLFGKLPEEQIKL